MDSHCRAPAGAVTDNKLTDMKIQAVRLFASLPARQLLYIDGRQQP